MNPNERTVLIRLKRNQVCRLLVMLAALAHSDDPESVRKHWVEIHESIKQDLADHDVKWRDRNAV